MLFVNHHYFIFITAKALPLMDNRNAGSGPIELQNTLFIEFIRNIKATD